MTLFMHNYSSNMPLYANFDDLTRDVDYVFHLAAMARLRTSVLALTRGSVMSTSSVLGAKTGMSIAPAL